MGSRPRRSSSFQSRPALMPPGTHFRQPGVELERRSERDEPGPSGGEFGDSVTHTSEPMQVLVEPKADARATHQRDEAVAVVRPRRRKRAAGVGRAPDQPGVDEVQATDGQAEVTKDAGVDDVTARADTDGIELVEEADHSGASLREPVEPESERVQALGDPECALPHDAGEAVAVVTRRTRKRASPARTAPPRRAGPRDVRQSEVDDKPRADEVPPADDEAVVSKGLGADVITPPSPEAGKDAGHSYDVRVAQGRAPAPARGSDRSLVGASADRTRSRRGPLLAMVVVLVLVVVTSLVVLLLQSGDGPDVASPTPTSSASSSRPPSPTSAPPATSSPPTTRAQGVGPPVELPADAAYTRVTMLDSGELEVTQWIRSSAPLSAITLSLPPDPFLGDALRAADLHVVADGSPIAGPVSPGPEPTVLALTAARAVDLSYRLTGALVRAASRPDRVLARRLSLDLSYEPRTGPAFFSFEGATVLSLACAEGTASDTDPQPCGKPTTTGAWEVREAELDGIARVLALLELPETSPS